MAARVCGITAGTWNLVLGIILLSHGYRWGSSSLALPRPWRGKAADVFALVGAHLELDLGGPVGNRRKAWHSPTRHPIAADHTCSDGTPIPTVFPTSGKISCLTVLPAASGIPT
jgi:hypothetical protein